MSIVVDSVTVPPTGPVSASNLLQTFKHPPSTGQMSLGSCVAWYAAYIYFENLTTPASWTSTPQSISEFRGLTGPKLSSYPKIQDEIGLPGAIATQLRYPLYTSGAAYTVNTTRHRYTFQSDASWAGVSLRNNLTEISAIDLARYARLRALSANKNKNVQHPTVLASALKEAKLRGSSIYLNVDMSTSPTGLYSGTLMYDGIPQVIAICLVVNGDTTNRGITLFYMRGQTARTIRTFDITSYIDPATISTLEANIWFNVYDLDGEFASGYITVYGLSFSVNE